MYVGSAGAAYLPVMFADRIVLPAELAPDVSEKVVFMPETFYFNSHPSSFPLSSAASCPPSERSRWSLPASGVVLLNHNQFYKFDRFSFYTMLGPLARTPLNPKPQTLCFVAPNQVTKANLSGALRRLYRMREAQAAAHCG